MVHVGASFEVRKATRFSHISNASSSSRHPPGERGEHICRRTKRGYDDQDNKRRAQISFRKKLGSWDTILTETNSNDFVVFEEISRFEFAFRRRGFFLEANSNCLCVRGSITDNVTVHVHALWLVCTQTIPIRMLLCPCRFMMTHIYIYIFMRCSLKAAKVLETATRRTHETIVEGQRRLYSNIMESVPDCVSL